MLRFRQKEKIKDILAPLVDLIFIPLTFLSAVLLKLIRKTGIQRMPVSRKILIFIGVFPIRDHYYEPLFNPAHLKKPLNRNRFLPGIDLNVSEQLAILSKFNYNKELESFPVEPTHNLEYYYKNSKFRTGDAEYLYNIIRHYKPKKIIEIGSGFSTLMAINAINKNKREDKNYECRYICIEPYEMRRFEKLDIELHRTRVEEEGKSLFEQLEANDLLFIDSSHVIRPQGDVLCEYLEILPILNSGVIVHIHDIYTPENYPNDWLKKEVRFWNEQYLLEAFLSLNKEYRIIAALNYLKTNHYNLLIEKCPMLNQFPNKEVGSFYIMRN